MIGILADIHGNAWALEAVLADARRRNVNTFIDLGDVLYGPLAPRRTFDLLRSIPLAAQVKGNQDRFVVEGAGVNATVDWVRQDLGAEAIAWLDALPAVAEWNGWLLCHGTPSSDLTYLLEDVSAGGQPQMRSAAAIIELLGAGVTQTAVLCGHTHVPRLVRLPSGLQILNPGSIGLPAYDDLAPAPHRMETFSPHACYATWDDYGVMSFHRVPYDWQAAAAQARQLGRDDWAQGIACGWMSPAE